MSDPRPASASSIPVLAGSEAGHLLNSTAWEDTPLGPMAQWPQSLRVAAGICLNSRFPMFLWWGPSLVNIYNDAYIPMLGLKHPGAFGRPATDSWSEIWPVLEPQVGAVIRDGRASWNERVPLTILRNGVMEDCWFTWSYSPIHGDGGAIDGLFCAVTEETLHVRAEAALARLSREAADAAHTLRTWFNNAPGFIAILRGPDFVFEMVNQAYYQLIGHRDLEGRPLAEALPEAQEQGFAGLLEDVYATGEPFIGRAMRILVQRTPGAPKSEAFVDFVYQPVRDVHGKVVAIFAQGSDVSEQVRAVQALRDADRQKDEFLATLAHELRNPLAPIRQAAMVARSGAADSERKAWALDVIERQAGHMALLLDDLLDVSRISRGRLDLRLEPVDLQQVVDSALEISMPSLERKNHRLAIELPAAPVRLLADPLRLAQVLCNLLSNASKYTDHGGNIALRAGTDGREVTIRVQDDGIGLAPEAQDHIFEMFSQISSAIDRAEGGLGIGLALSRGLVGLHRGTIAVRSAGVGTGSEFVVTLPLAPADDAGISPAHALPAQGRSGEPARRKVLIADDNADALETMVALLEMEGHEVQAASDGHKALALAQQMLPDIAILDIGMPGLNGNELAARIRASDWGRDVTLIALTGWGQAEDRARSSAAGFDHHLTKPVDFDRLNALLAAGSV
ncbi:ATP-binding protein [Caenimonas terrae]|uniref:histidine kinase n=1 Tax=Caenimonas terrae TaxID=696074 RepID=A0ABW0NJV2_9BURK